MSNIRDDLRKNLIGNTPKGQTRTITLFGQEMELHQPSFEAMMALQTVESNKQQAIIMIIQYCFVPGTDERIFEDGDEPQIAKWPFGGDLLALQEAIADMTEVDITGEEAKQKKDPLDEAS